jgi:hypothetical protein
VSCPNCSLSLEDLLEAAPICNSWAYLGSEQSGKYFLARCGTYTPEPSFGLCSSVSQLTAKCFPLRSIFHTL